MAHGTAIRQSHKIVQFGILGAAYTAAVNGMCSYVEEAAHSRGFVLLCFIGAASPICGF